MDERRALAEAQGNAFTTPEWYLAYAKPRLLAQLDAGARRVTEGLSPAARAQLRAAAAPVLTRLPATRSR